ncbi:hypothetical protein ACC676_39425, partial [Rhizobium ruizarguesonis]
TPSLPFHDRLHEAARSIPAEPEAPAGTLAAPRAEAAACTRCPLHAKATQTVFGAGRVSFMRIFWKSALEICYKRPTKIVA